MSPGGTAADSRYTFDMSDAAVSEDRLVYDWNGVNRRGRLTGRNVSFFDETLRDGIQNPSVTDPRQEDKLELIHLMDEIGIHVADIGLPGSSKRNYDDVVAI